MAVHWESSVNVILVVGHEKLNVEMQRTYGNRMTVVKIPKSGGVCALLGTCGFPLLNPTRRPFFRSSSSTCNIDSASMPSNCTPTFTARRSRLRVGYRPQRSAMRISTESSRRAAPSSRSAASSPSCASAKVNSRAFSLSLSSPLSRAHDVPRLSLSSPESMAPSSALPIGATRTVNEMQPISLDPASPGSGLLNAIVALLALPTHPEEMERYDEEVLD